ncbi:hypothetical protein ACJX0J_026911, partial [Zea mays]
TGDACMRLRLGRARAASKLAHIHMDGPPRPRCLQATATRCRCAANSPLRFRPDPSLSTTDVDQVVYASQDRLVIRICLMLEAILLFQATVSGMLLTAEMAFKCARGLPPEAAAEPIVKEAVEAKGLRDDTTCINNYPEPDLEEVFEDGCPSLSRSSTRKRGGHDST